MVEMLVVIAIIGILAALLLPVLERGKAGAKRIQCVGQLKQTGIAFHSFAHDHRSRFPMLVPVSEGGTMEFVQSGYRVAGDFYFSFRHFQVLANELGSPKILVCPSDLARLSAADFDRLKNENLSYLVGVTAEPGNAGSILAGDRNLTNDWSGSRTILQAGRGSLIRWTRELHGFKGNLLYADGHVEELNSLRPAEKQNASGTLVLPSVKPPGAAVAVAFSGNSGLALAQRSPTGGGTRPNFSTTTGSAEVDRPAPATNRSQLRPGGSASSPLAVTRQTRPSRDSVADTKPVPPETNRVVAATPGTPTQTVKDSGGSPFMRWFADMAQQIVGWAKWLLWLLLLLLLVVLVVLRLRQLDRRKNR